MGQHAVERHDNQCFQLAILHTSMLHKAMQGITLSVVPQSALIVGGGKIISMVRAFVTTFEQVLNRSAAYIAPVYGCLVFTMNLMPSLVHRAMPPNCDSQLN
jgi:uncharacterized membrane protein